MANIYIIWWVCSFRSSGDGRRSSSLPLYFPGIWIISYSRRRSSNSPDVHPVSYHHLHNIDHNNLCSNHISDYINGALSPGRYQGSNTTCFRNSWRSLGQVCSCYRICFWINSQCNHKQPVLWSPYIVCHGCRRVDVPVARKRSSHHPDSCASDNCMCHCV